MVALPAQVKSFLDANADREDLVFHGTVEGHDDDEHDVQLDANAASSVLAGEDDFDDERYAAIGFLNDDVPIFVDVTRKGHPVHAWIDGAAVRVHREFASWADAIAKPRVEKPPPKIAAGGPTKVLPGPKTVDWPTDPVVALALGDQGSDFLWFGYGDVKPKKNHELLLRYVRPQGHRTDFAVGAKWDAKASMKMDRGTGKWLDVSVYDGRTPVVTPRLRAILENIQPQGLEFLPVRATVGRSTADVFLVNVTLAVACLDVAASGLDEPYSTYPRRQSSPRALVILPAKVPPAPCFFRLAEYPELILATRAMVDAFRAAPPSGLRFVPLSQSRYASL
jgi:hypothetical protein